MLHVKNLRAKAQLAALLLTASMVAGARTPGTELKVRTVDAFQQYVERTEARMNGEIGDPQRFLFIDSLPDDKKQDALSRLQHGQVIAEPLYTKENGKDIEVPDGLVHHWQAVGFIPGVTCKQMLAMAQDYSRQPQVYAPDVLQAQLVSRSGRHDTVAFRLHRQAIITVVYNAEFSVDYFVPDSTHGYSVSRATRIAEVQNPGKSDEKELPVGNDHGYLWRLNLYTRYLERDNGVYIQIEFLALSRSVPRFFAWLVNPYIRSVPREYLTNYVLATRKALIVPAQASRIVDNPQPTAYSREAEVKQSRTSDARG